MEVPLEIDVVEAARLTKLPSTVLLDVRESYEYADCHVPGSLHIPMGQIPGRLADLPPDRHILVLCHAGVRSLRVTRFLRDNNLPLASNIAGGIAAWAEVDDSELVRH